MRKLTYRDAKTLGFIGWQRMVYVELKALLSNKQVIITQLLVPTMYFLFYGFGLTSTFSDIAFYGKQVNFMDFIFVGIIGIMINTQLNQSVYRIILDRKWGILAFKYFKGVKPTSYLLGKLFFPLTAFTLQLLSLYAISMVTGHAISITVFASIVVMSLISVLFWFSLGTLISLKVSTYKSRDLILNTILLPVTFTAPIFYTFEQAPRIIYLISRLNPLTYQLNTLRGIIFDMPQVESLIVTISLSLCMLILAMHAIKTSKLNVTEH